MRIIFVIIFSAQLFLFPSSAYATQEIYAPFIKGKPQLLRGKEISIITKNTRFQHNDIIKTRKNELLIMKSQASTYKITPHSFVKLDLSVSEIIQSEVAWGSVVVHFAKDLLSESNNESSKKEIVELKIKTKSASLGVRGTTLFTYVEKSGETTTSVEHGHVNLAQKEQSIDIRDGQSLMVSGVVKNKKAESLGFEKHINWSLDEKGGKLDHPAQLFESIQKKWDDYKQENQKTWESYKDGMNKKWRN